MKKTEYNKIKEYIMEFYEGGIKDLKAEVEHYKELPETHGLAYQAGLKMVEYGNFACYFGNVLDIMAEWYGDEFDETRYINKDETWKYKNGECYIWSVFKHKMAMAIEKMVKE